jgi:pimeloyl-ACP methyl ester carboxylesterase
MVSGPVGVLGISFGANLAMQWAAQDDRLASVVAVAPFDDPILAAERFARQMHIPVSKRSVRTGFQRLAATLEIDWSEWTGSVAALESRNPIFFIAGGQDAISPEIEVARLKSYAPAGSRLLVVPEANHDALGLWLHELAGPVKAWLESTVSPSSLRRASSLNE